MISHRAFIRQTDGITVVSNGQQMVTFDTPALWAASGADWTPPDGVSAVAYERHGGELMHHHTLADGTLVVLTAQDAALEAIIDDVARLDCVRADMEHPLWGVTDVALARIIAAGKADTTAEAIRLQYVTPGAGQAMVYQAKEAEARDLKTAQSVDAANYPHLSAEVGVTADSLDAVADVVLAMAAAWRIKSAAIEGARLRIKRMIKEADNVAAVKAALDNAEWPV